MVVKATFNGDVRRRRSGGSVERLAAGRLAASSKSSRASRLRDPNLRQLDDTRLAPRVRRSRQAVQVIGFETPTTVSGSSIVVEMDAPAAPLDEAVAASDPPLKDTNSTIKEKVLRRAELGRVRDIGQDAARDAC